MVQLQLTVMTLANVPKKLNWYTLSNCHFHINLYHLGTCKTNVQGFKCDGCKDTFYNFPTTTSADDDCDACDCKSPGSTSSSCDR